MSSNDTHGNPSAPRDHHVPLAPPLSPHASGTGPVRSLARAVFERRDEYLTRQNLRVKIGTWNVAALEGTEKDLKSWFVQGKGVSAKLAGLRLDDGHDDGGDDDDLVESVAHQERRATAVVDSTPRNDPGILPGGDDIGLYVLGLQEVVDITSPTGTLLSYNDPNAAKKWREAVSEALPAGYTYVAEHQLIGLYLNVFASAEVAKTISSVSTISVGTGLMGYMGNKGAVAARIVVGEATKMVFINSHLAAGTEKGTLERRNWDASQITHRMKFDPVDYGNGIVEDSSDGLGEEHFTFWFGDLNYRLGDIPGDDVRRLLMLHTRNEYDARQESIESLVKIDHELGNLSENDSKSPFVVDDDGDEETLDPEDDPASLQTTLSSLLPHDQLHEQMRTNKAFHDGWSEGPLNFLPTYKYDVGSVGMFDSSEKRRAPSWCDRILYRSQKGYLTHLRKVKDAALAEKKDAEMKARGLHEGPEETVLFDYNPDTDGADDLFEAAEVAHGDDLQHVSDSEEDDALRLLYYTSHQRVLSSDHKPLNAIFDLTFHAADLAKKAEISAAVAKELDRDENEARPNLTLIFDQIDARKDEKNELDYGRISFDEPKVRHITVANTGSVVAHFGIVQDELPGARHRQWVVLRMEDHQSSESLHRTNHSLHPGETINITCTLHITSLEDVRALNYGQAAMEDVQVLRVQDGRDHFITSRFQWLNSCFGLSLEKLIRIPERGVRSCRLDSHLDKEPVRWSAPRELFRLTETLEEVLERAVAEWKMKEEVGPPPWETAGWPFVATTWTFQGEERQKLKHNIRDTLDLGANFSLDAELTPVAKSEALAETLLTFLDSIDDGVINEELWTSLSSALHEREKAKKHLDADTTRALILEEMSGSSARSVAFTFITFMLARVANEVAPVPSDDGGSEPDTKSSSSKPVAKASELLKKGIRRSVGGESAAAKRREVERRFADVFSDVIFKLGPSDPKTKEKRAAEERRRNIVAIFLHTKTDDRAL